MKKCTKCGIEKPLTAECYHRDKSVSTGFKSHCKACVRKYHQDNKERFAEYYQDNKERKLKYNAKYYQSNKEKFAQKNAEYRKNNKEKILKIAAEYHKNNKEKILKKAAEYHKNNKEKILKKKSEYYQSNKEKFAQKNAEYQKNNKEKILKKAAEYYYEKKAQQPACVYQIVNSVNNKIYIGETIRGELRWKEHLGALRGNRHNNHRLQEDYNKFGEEVFTWSIIEEYPKDKDTLLLEEIKAIDKLLKEGKELYNLSLTIDQLKLLMENK